MMLGTLAAGSAAILLRSRCAPGTFDALLAEATVPTLVGGYQPFAFLDALTLTAAPPTASLFRMNERRVH